MCDWEESEYAEYLLWVEAEKARSSARPVRAEEPRAIPLPRVRLPDTVAAEA